VAVVIEVAITPTIVRQMFIDLMGGYTGYFSSYFPKYFTGYFPAFFASTPLTTTANILAGFYRNTSTALVDTVYFKYVKNSNVRTLYFTLTAGGAGGAGGYYNFSTPGSASFMQFQLSLPGVFTIDKDYGLPVVMYYTTAAAPTVLNYVSAWAVIDTTYDTATNVTNITINLRFAVGGAQTNFVAGNVYSVSLPPIFFEGSNYYN